MMCQACSEGRHYACGQQSWCECECDPEVALIDLAFWDEFDWGIFGDDWDDGPSSHGLDCTCETCLQEHPERLFPVGWDDEELQ